MVSSLRLSLVFISTAQAAAFIAPSLVPSRSAVVGTTKLGFGFNGLGSPKPSKDEEDAATDKPEKKIGAAGLLQLITAGMGAPFLGDYQGVDDDGKMMFSLEANNLVDEFGNSKQTQMPYFENGWVEEKDETQSKSDGGFKFPWQK